MSEVAAKGCQDTNNDKNEKEDHKLTGQSKGKKNCRKCTAIYSLVYAFIIMYVFMCSSVPCTVSSSYSSFDLRNVGSQKFWLRVDCKTIFAALFIGLDMQIYKTSSPS